ncbi:hypothetical protein EZL74_01835 [Flavobacterium silvisoli]|uniref:Uncharacterized protein n=1 Tax=Flavobacterium silvisoli TaxID=2529433 RepID=A0A4Q9Z4Q4_9FLAO|nr:hypothetical protein [Flavobacterium silvisoli]TBX71272.1 hypothetical protein EZL74_01835 [Flavobacterium silvisoli]
MDINFNQYIAANNFREIAAFFETKPALSEEQLAEIRQLASHKLELARIALSPPYSDFSKILFVKEGDFYVFLNYIKNQDIEEQLKSMLTLISKMYQQNPSSELAGKSFIAVNNFKADDDELAELIRENNYSSEIIPTPAISKRNRNYLILAVVLVFVLIRGVIFFNAFHPFQNRTVDYDYDASTEEYNAEPPSIDPYYTRMKFQIDSFFVFLSDYKKEEIKQLTRINDIKTGENPFETFYQSMPQGESNSTVKISNHTNCDMILLENAMVYDTIKLPKAAYYIKSGKTIEVNKRPSDVNAVFNFYLGKQLATFQTKSKHLFIRNHSVIEYRFSELLPETKEILETDYVLREDASVSLKDGILRIN